MKRVLGSRRALGLLVVALVAVLLWAGNGGGGPDSRADGGPRAAPTATSADAGSEPLPAQVRRTLEVIETGGPFPYRQDGSTFGNREGLLPQRPSGYYREYTVPTPGASDRGARRLVVGAGGEVYYTADHYRSFTRIDTGRGVEP